MKIKVTNTRSKILEFPAEPWRKQLLKDFTKKSKNSYWQMRQTPHWDGTTSFISKELGLFPTGLLEDILFWAKDNDEEVEIVDERINPCPNPKTKQKYGDYELRHYQIDAVLAALTRHRGIIKVGTGGGKSLIAAAILDALRVKSLFICERMNLAIQTKEKFVKDYKIPAKDVGIVGGKYNETGRLITVATIQSAHRLEDLELYECLICDEIHHAKAKTYLDLFKRLSSCYYRIGLSGTPFGDDDVENTYRISQFGPLIYEIKTQELVKEGVLSKPTIRMIEINSPNLWTVKDYQQQYKLGIAQNKYRNSIISRFANELRGKTMILFKLIEHGKILQQLIPDAIYLDGDTPAEERHKFLKSFNRATEGKILSSMIFDEGIDVETIAHLINCSGEQSPIKVIQRLGRGLRADGTGDITNVIDFLDRTCKNLEKHSKNRIKLYKSEGHDIKTFQLEK